MAERDEHGRFKKGEYKGGPGRPTKEREIKFYEVTLSSVSLDDWKVIVKKAVDQAKSGDGVARKWLADYLIGEPEKNVNLKTDIIEVLLMGND